jgi:hypothetical protein
MIFGNAVNDYSQVGTRKRGLLGLEPNNIYAARNKFQALQGNKANWIGEENKEFAHLHFTGLSSDCLEAPNLNLFLRERGIDGYIMKPILHEKDFGTARFLQENNYMGANYRGFMNIITAAGNTMPQLYGANGAIFFDPDILNEAVQHAQDLDAQQGENEKMNNDITLYNANFATKAIGTLSKDDLIKAKEIFTMYAAKMGNVETVNWADQNDVVPVLKNILFQPKINQELLDKLQQHIDGNTTSRKVFEAPNEFYQTIQRGFYPWKKGNVNDKRMESIMASRYANAQYEKQYNSILKQRNLKDKVEQNYFVSSGQQKASDNIINQIQLSSNDLLRAGGLLADHVLYEFGGGGGRGGGGGSGRGVGGSGAGIGSGGRGDPPDEPGSGPGGGGIRYSGMSTMPLPRKISFKKRKTPTETLADRMTNSHETPNRNEKEKIEQEKMDYATGGSAYNFHPDVDNVFSFSFNPLADKNKIQTRGVTKAKKNIKITTIQRNTHMFNRLRSKPNRENILMGGEDKNTLLSASAPTIRESFIGTPNKENYTRSFVRNMLGNNK